MTLLRDKNLGVPFDAGTARVDNSFTDQGSLPRSLNRRRIADLSKKPPRIAIVDDDEAVREATQSLMQYLGYHPSTFPSAKEFLESDQIHDTSCLISDLRMPGLSGIDLQDRLNARGHRIPIIFITGHPEDGTRARAMKAGAVDFMSKPYNDENLIAGLDKALKAS